jgi:plasmid stabilization system protein ParE
VACKVIFTKDSLVDLELILDHLRADSQAANRFGTALLNHIELLQGFPDMGTPVPRRPGVRKLLHSPVRVYYRFREEQALVEILHLWHAAQRQPKFRSSI